MKKHLVKQKNNIKLKNKASLVECDARLEFHKLEQQVEFSNNKILEMNQIITNLNQVVATLYDKLSTLSSTIDVYKERDIEQRNRIKQLEFYEKYDYIESIVLEIIRVRTIVIKKLKTITDETQVELLKTMLKHLDVSLSRSNVYAYSSKEGDSFDPSIHTALSKEDAPNKQLRGKICASMSDGYYLTYFLDEQKKQRIISYEKVTVYKEKGEK